MIHIMSIMTVKTINIVIFINKIFDYLITPIVIVIG